MDKIIFDGVNKLIIIKMEYSSVDVRSDIYTEWVSWSAENSNFQYAIRYTGGEPTFGGQLSGIIFFLINDWQIYLDHSVVFNGSIFSDDFESPFITSPGVHIATSVSSSLVTQIPGTSISQDDINQIKQSVWEENLSSYSSGTAASQINLIAMMETLIGEMHKLNGLDGNHITSVSKSGRKVDNIEQVFDTDQNGVVSIRRV